jgi:hypothetical protein
MAFALQTDTGTVQAYFFECDDDRLFAVSIDPHGGNIPRNACPEGWRLSLMSSAWSPSVLAVHRSDKPERRKPPPEVRGRRLESDPGGPGDINSSCTTSMENWWRASPNAGLIRRKTSSLWSLCGILTIRGSHIGLCQASSYSTSSRERPARSRLPRLCPR